MATPTKQQILAALELAIDDHKAFAGKFGVDWEFIAGLRAAATIVQAASVVAVPCALAED